ncbi:hypothetical protein AB0952_22910 [Streptomyces caniferus]|uniref:hypothetical protein n=1 Tax=Streptomyces caniferus TaxID=285557 RepID=UPI0033F53D42
MSWDDEWAALKREAADGRGLQLASAGGGSWQGGSGDGSGDVKSKRSVWTTAGREVQSLRGDIAKALTKLEDEQQGLGAGASGVQSAAAQQDVYRSWKRYLEALSGRCGAIQAQMEKAGGALYGNDAAVKGSFSKLSQKYEDTPAVGGRQQGK